MIRINKQYLYRFKKSRCEYLYPLSRGSYLAFDSDSLEYIGIELFYLPRDPGKPEREAYILLTDLLSKNILETTL